MSGQTGLSTTDRALLRSVFSWARASGWRRDNYWNDYDVITCSTWVWKGKAPEDEVFVEKDTLGAKPGCWRLVARTPLPDVELGCDERLDVTQAVDVLCALGVLPAHLSSSWIAGRESALTREEWRVAYRAKPGSAVDVLRGDVVSMRQEAEERRRFAPPLAWLEHRRTGASDWERVTDVD